jgi:hypothetical protein
MNRDTAEQTFREPQRVVPLARHVAQDAHRFTRDLGADAISGQDKNVEVHLSGIRFSAGVVLLAFSRQPPV